MRSNEVQIGAVLAAGFVIGNLVSAWINAAAGNEFGTGIYGYIQAAGSFWGPGVAFVFLDFVKRPNP